jgi:cell division protein FtsN
MVKKRLIERIFTAGPYLSRMVLSFLLLSAPSFILADNLENEPLYEETTLTLSAKQGGKIEIPAVISGKTAYLSISGLFSFLKIKNTVSSGLDTISGYIENLADQYLIDKSKNVISYKNKIFQISNRELVKTETDLYLCTKSFEEIFGLECTFYFRSLSVDLRTNVELPLFREMRQEEMRKFIRKMKGEIIADTNIGRKNPVFQFGTADWAFYSTQVNYGKSNTRASFVFGGYLAGGETTLGLNYYNNQPFSLRNQFYRWRYVNNDHKALRQVTAGKITTQSISSIFSPVVGIQLTNSPTTYRKFYGTYTLNERTEPGWIVELYVNNTMVDYVKADASGFFTFQVPLAYGNTEVRLRFYGPWGEEKSNVQNILIPFTFLPKHELEYTLSAGLVEDSLNLLFYRNSINYGLSNKFSLGGGYEYLSSIKSGRNIPFLNTSFSIARNLLCTGEYAYGVRTKGLLSFRMPSNFIMELSYANYNKNQKAIYYNYREERKASISFPVRFNRFTVNSRVSVNQIVLPGSTHMTMSELVISSSFSKISANLHTYGFFYAGDPTVYSDFSLGLRIPSGINITPTIRYNLMKNEMTGFKCKLEKSLFVHGYLSMAYEQYTDYNIKNFQIGFRYMFSFAQASVYANHSNNATSISQAVNGSIIFDPLTSYVKASNINKVGRGGITVLPFLDINCNGKRDKGEPKVSGLSLKVTPGGRVEIDDKDTLIRVFDLEAYTNTYLEFSGPGFENISWQLRNKTYCVAIDPNMMKLVEIPVCVIAEVSGSVFIKCKDNMKQRERTKVCIYRRDAVLVNSFYVEDDGYYNYMGLTPGTYTLMIDSGQLRKLNMASFPASHQLIILPAREGAVFEGMNFKLDSLDSGSGASLLQEKDKSLHQANVPKNIIDSTALNAEKISDVQTELNEGQKNIYYVIQIGAFKKKSNARNAKSTIVDRFFAHVEIINTDGYDKVLVTGFTNLKQAIQMMNKFRLNGYPEAFLRKLHGGHIVLPFVDYNCNGFHEKNEPKFKGITAKLVSGGWAELDEQDTLMRIFNISDSANIIVNLDGPGVEPIVLRLKHLNQSKAACLNMMESIEVPFCLKSDVSGYIRMEGPNIEKKTEMVKVYLYRNDSLFASSSIKDYYGHYSFEGLTPGNYRLMLDTAVLSKFKLAGIPFSRTFVLPSNNRNMAIIGMDFIIREILSDSATMMFPRSDTIPAARSETGEKNPRNSYCIQVGGFLEQSNAKAVKRRIINTFGLHAEIINNQGYYKVMVTGYDNWIDATAIMNKLRKNGCPGSYIRCLKDGIIQ